MVENPNGKLKTRNYQGNSFRSITGAPWFVINANIRRELMEDALSRQIRERNPKMIINLPPTATPLFKGR